MINSIHGIISKSAPAVTPPDGLVILNNWVLTRMEIINGNDFRPSGGDALGWSPSYIPAGGVGFIQGRSFITIFGLDREPKADPYTSMDYAVWRANNTYAGTFNLNVGTENVIVPIGTIERVRCDGTFVHQEYSLDDGVTWTHLIPPTAQVQEKLYPKISTDPGEYLDDVFVSLGFLTD